MPATVIQTASGIAEIPNWFAVCMGIGTVFVGLICIIILCSVMGIFFRENKSSQKAPTHAKAPQKLVENRQEIIAAVCAAAAEEMGTDISAIRVLSFKKL